MEIEINHHGVEEQRKRSTETYKLIIGGPIFFSFLMLLAWLALHSDKYGYDERTIKILFWVLGIFGLVLFSVFFLVIPISAAKRFNRVIKALKVKETSIAGSTCKVAWLRGQNFEVNRQSIKYSKPFEISYGSGIRYGFILKLGNKEFYLIKDFFDDFEEVKKLLS